MSNLGVRNNNWLNIRHNPANDWVGQTGGDANNYAKFDDPVNGLRAADIVLKNYGAKHGIDNLNDAISRFAPPEDNNPTSGYAQFVADKMGISPDDKIDLEDPATREKMIAAMVQFETPDATSMYSPNLLAQARGSNISNTTSTTPAPAAIQDTVASFSKRAAPAQQLTAAPPSDAVASYKASLKDDPSLTVDMVMDNSSYNQSFAPSGLIETFRRGMTAGAEGLAADLKYMGAAVDALQGDEEGVATSIENARIAEEFAALPLQDIESFGEFWDNKTVYGFFEQVSSGTGQLIPNAISSITGAGVGSIGMALGKEALTASSRAAAKNIIKDSLIAVSRKKASKEQADIAQASFEAARDAHIITHNRFLRGEARKKGAKIGAVAGAGVSEFLPLTGSNVRESLESGRELDRGQALRAGVIAAPQAAIGVLGEVGLLKLIGNQAAKKSAGPNSVMGRLADATSKNFLKGGAIEGGTELLQEELAIRNRMSMDNSFTEADANLRRLNAGFVGFFGGGAIAGGGAGLVQTAKEVIGADLSGSSAAVTQKASEMTDSIKELMTRAKTTQEVADAESGQTTQESERDINAQLQAMLDPTSTKEAVWISGSEPDPRYGKRGTPKKININGETAYSAFVPGRGTIISTDIDVVANVVKAQASDSVLAEALGYSATKSDNDTHVVRVFDKDGGIVSEETFVNEDSGTANLEAIFASANNLKPEGGRVEVMPIDEALADRARRAGPDIQFMEDDGTFDDGDDDPSETSDFESEVRTYSFNRGGKTETTYKAVDDDSYAGVAPARTAYEAEFGETDWELPFYKRMSESLLKTATTLQRTNKDEIVDVKINVDGSYRIDMETTPDTRKIRLREKGVETEVSLGEFLEKSIAQAGRSKYRDVSVKAPGSDKFTTVNLVDLTNAGRRLNEADTGSFTGDGPVESQRQGLLAMLGELRLAEYEVEIKGIPVDALLENIENPSKELPDGFNKITAGFNNKKPISLDKLLKPYVPGAAVENTVEVDVQNDTQTQQEKIYRDVDGNELAREPDPFNVSTARSFNRAVVDEVGDTTQTEEITVAEAMERRQEDAPITNTAEIAENSARTFDGSPLSRLNIEETREGVNTAQNRPRGGTAQNKASVESNNSITFPFGAGKGKFGFIPEIAQRLHRAVNFKTPISVISIRQFDEAIRKDIRALVLKKTSAEGKIALKKLETLDLGDPQAVGVFVQDLANKNILSKRAANWVATQTDATVIGDDIVLGSAFTVLKPFTSDLRVAKEIADMLRVYLPKGNTKKGAHRKFRGGSVIAIDDLHNTNETGLAMVLAHELGHALYKQEFDAIQENKPLRERMWKAFEADRQKANDEGNPIKQWNEVGFEEWYADQVSAWVKRDMELAAHLKGHGVVAAHFKKLVRQFKKLWDALPAKSGILSRQGKLDSTFAEYMTEVVKRRNAATVQLPAGAVQTAEGRVQYSTGLGSIELDVPDGPPAEQKAVAVAVREAIEAQIGTKRASDKWARYFRSIGKDFARKHPSLIESMKFVLSTDTVLRLIDRTDTIADMFYVPSNTKAGVGFVKQRQLARDKMRADLFDILGTDWDNKATQDVLEELESEKPTAELSPKAQEVRKFLESIHSDYIVPSNSNIGFIENYFPRMLDLAEVAANPDPLVEEILKQDPKANVKKVRQAISRLAKYQTAMLNDNGDVDMRPEDVFDPAKSAEAELQLTKSISPRRLRELGYVLPPEIALLGYIDRITKRVEWNKHTKRDDGSSKLLDAMQGMNAREQELVMSITNAYLGNISPMEPFWRKVNSYAQLIQTVTILPFAFFSSIADFAGPIVNTREFNGFTMFGKQLVAMMKNKSEAERLANDIGVTMSEAAATAWMSQADGELLDPTVRVATEKYFKYIGLDFLTTLSRQFASGMGRQFILEHANHPTKRSARYLEQLGVTAEQVKAWQASDFNLGTEDGKAVKEALVRFVESSVLRPSAAERPIWANDPRFALIWQLKSFMYSFNKTILGGVEREFMQRLSEDRNLATALVPIFFLTAAAFLPLAAMGLELREYAKVGLSYAIPGIDGSNKYLKSDSMDWGTYMTELWDRAGLNGPASILLSAQRSAEWGNSGLATVLGPTAESIEKIITDFPRFDTPVTDRVTQPAGAVGAAAGLAAFGPQIAKAIL